MMKSGKSPTKTTDKTDNANEGEDNENEGNSEEHKR